MTNYLKSLILGIQFLTRIPIKTNLNVDEQDFTRASVFFPFVGWIIGLILFICGKGFIFLGFSPLLSGTLMTFILVYLTGGLHLDGLSDSFDGLYSGRGKDRILEIMKDSRVGAFGVLSLLAVILLKMTLFAELFQMNQIQFVILAPVFSRWMVVILSYKSVYARESGMGNYFIGKISDGHLAIATMTMMLAGFVDLRALLTIPFLMVFTYGFKKSVYKKIDGLTGDILGAINEMGETLFLLFAIILLSL